jgi:hypothetical protein
LGGGDGGRVVPDRPTLVRERLRPGPGGKDYGAVVVLTALMLGQSLVAGLDVCRFH